MNHVTECGLVRDRFYERARRTVSDARRLTRDVLSEWGLYARVEDVQLCVSELATNAIVHAVPPGRGYKVRLAWEAHHQVLRLEVHDSGGWWPLAEEPEWEIGHGLALVEELADSWGVRERKPGHVVWCEFGASRQAVGVPSSASDLMSWSVASM
ncbi:ATP-binding protein [Streptomyces sp. TRM64462]|uniref:ATP-binding protein n=1 Tax=Streptomyces sp. TRM64462 TaxID=2741726 RepID=UPI001586D6E3|nr:ATP-binding protein [Streptomyces sp. TRM64462]